VRLPLIVHHPDPRLAGRRVGEFVSAVDLMPTVLGRLGIAGPERMTGLDAWPTVDGAVVRDHVVSGFGGWGSVRTAEWNYVFPTRPPEPERGLLFNRLQDPDELGDVASAHPDAVAEMRELAGRVWPQAG
jgi:arylsulfatase A-like enzyme